MAHSVGAIRTATPITALGVAYFVSVERSPIIVGKMP